MKFCLLLFFTFMTFVTNAQLLPFTLNVNSTNETCINNGTVSASVQNTTSGSTISYQVFKLPNISTPISTNPNTTGLSAGDYKIVATQTLITPQGPQTNFEEKTVTITNQIVDLSVNITKSNVSSCGTKGSIIITTSTGNPVSYEIIGGPVLMASQSSNQFNDLPAGKYQIRIVDSCGNSIKPEFTLVLIDPALSISGSSFPPILTSCSSIDVKNTVTVATGAEVAYPLTVVFTIHPPTGADQIINQTIPSGPVNSFDYIQNIAIASSASFTYDIKITDACGSVFQKLDNIVNPNPKIDISDLPGKCGLKFLNVSVKNYVPPFTLNFLQSPIGFSPIAYNASHPGPFSTTNVLYGDLANPTPFGTYEIEVTDACGRKDQYKYILKKDPVEPSAIGINNGCGSVLGSMFISLPQSRKIVFAEITAAPAAYAIPLPNNVSSLIEPIIGSLTINNLPIGLYNFTIKDDCGDTFFLVNKEVPAFVKQGLIVEQYPNCVFGSGSVKILSGNGILKSISVTSAPANYNQNLPFVVSNNIKNGILYLSDLPAGSYTLSGIDACDYLLTTTINIIGYDRTSPGFLIQRNCGTFDIALAETSNGVQAQAFWLQKFNSATNSWQHAVTGFAYVEGTSPNAATGLPLTNNSTIFNLTTIGTYRILKTFQSFDFGTSNNVTKTCIDDLGQFEYNGSLQILGAYTLDCEGGSGNSSMIVDVVGVPPYNFSIIERNGLPFFVNNGANNTFVGLTQGSYKVEVTDKCIGKTATFTLSALTGLAKAFATTNILDCRTDGNQTNTFDLTTKKSTILGNQNPNNYNLTFHLNQPDVQNGANQIANPNFFANTSNPQTIFARVVHKTLTGCFATTNFKIFIGKTPKLSPQPTYILCDDRKLTLTVEAGYDSYLWSNGLKTNAIEISSAGDYTVTATNIYAASQTCSNTLTIKTVLSGKAKTITINTQDWTDNTNSIEVTATGNGVYQYSLDDVTYQDTNVFSNLLAGFYTVFVKDNKNACGTRFENVALLNYPKFFTPNGDGFNEFWKIKFSSFEPKLYTYIYDRYGKLITGFDVNSFGWDGTFNGQPLPADDYWFVVNRQDGRVYKGHFALKR